MFCAITHASVAYTVTSSYVLCVTEPASKPNWDALYETAAAQEGYFTTRQAADAGYSTHLLYKHIQACRVLRVRRGVYRLVHFPAGDHEELVVIWLWSDQAGVISHSSALSLHGLSDVLPAVVDLTLPSEWRTRRFRVPPGVVLHHADVPAEDRVWFGGVPTTNARRSLNDCARAGLSPDLLRQGARQALRRGLVTMTELPDVQKALESFGGLEA
ncbi:MAG: type IV toxin-antitoxin system AbiEi family antitoxin domain-containing protein [Sandaracinaceae bacterium]|nr:type IV toxin-antitoxin system AbiEi family antitoxin domain-containing protein [Myxococcales bacterium]MCB9656893.1 type IV toxin-antitoxin system AbiEi family antitoxin domain-containing protein [Sandaracinaceae bacterium]